MPFRECGQSCGSAIAKSGDFPVEFDDGDGLKNRRMECKKMCKRTSGDVTYTYQSAVRWLSGRKRRFAKAARDHRTGLKLTISGPFFIGNLLGVGCRMMVVGLRSGTPLGTLRMTPMCAF
jgi:hypothetical protein